MRKSYFSILTMLITSLSVIVSSCSDSDIPGLSNGDLKDDGHDATLIWNCVSSFIKSEYGQASLLKHSISQSELNLSKAQSHSSDRLAFDAFIIPIIRGKENIGTLNIVKDRLGESYRAIFEIQSKNQISGTKPKITVSTGEGLYIATLELKEDPSLDGEHWEIVDVAEVDDNEDEDGRRPGESWWSCTARIYHTMKIACNSNANCDLACDMIDLNSDLCTKAMAISAAAICIGKDKNNK